MVRARFIRASVLALATATLITVASSPSAIAETRLDVPAASTNNPHVALDVIRQLPPIIRDDPSVTIDPSYVPGPIIYPDGTPVPGQSAEMEAAAATCGGTVFGTAGGVWGPVSQGNCSLFGSPGYAHRYNWQRAAFVFTQGCVRVRGFNQAGESTWYSSGCGTSGGATVPWGNILAMPQAQAYSQAVAAGFTANWQG